MLGPSTITITQSIPLSNDTVSKRIDEMVADVEERLIDTLKNTEFVMQIDESTIRENEVLLLTYVRFINGNEEIGEELLFVRNLATDTKGSSIFKKVEEFFNEKNIPLTNVVACATDGAASMVGRYRGFQAHLKSVVPGVMTVHCVVHRQHLVSKNLSGRLHESLCYVINIDINTYPILWEEVKLLLLAFPSTYLVERGFGAIQQILSKSRNMLKISECGDLRMRLTKMVPDLKKLTSAHQAQGSH
ncbi:zinc finger MYM-type protein 6-like [Crotalus tigris]|uniref:zinc finger MYM-type protein 6-like n=1 Tax=Crotalus tigris TaxID=88082 RepID=UPI00192F57E6|nr:zinc finger MYM-type protein 6-like [Crotalus tigris]